jgi:hypothetical protein
VEKCSYFGPLLCFSKNLRKVNNRPIGINSPNLVTLIYKSRFFIELLLIVSNDKTKPKRMLREEAGKAGKLEWQQNCFGSIHERKNTCKLPFYSL